MTVRAPVVHAAVVRPDRGGREERDQRQALGRAELDVARRGPELLVVAGHLPGAAGAVERLVARALEVRAAVLPPRRDEADDRVDRLGPEPLRDERRRVLVQARVELLEARDHRELEPDADGREHLADRLGDAADGRVVHDDRLELEPDAVGPRLEPAASSSCAASRGSKPPVASTSGAYHCECDGIGEYAGQPCPSRSRRRAPAGRSRARSPAGRGRRRPTALVVEAHVDERRLLELDHLEVGVRREPVDVEQRGVLEAVDLAALERRGALAVVEDRDPADPVEVGGPVVRLPRRARAA